MRSSTASAPRCCPIIACSQNRDSCAFCRNRTCRRWTASWSKPRAREFPFTTFSSARRSAGATVWTGRALQAEYDDLEKIGLALLYPALERSLCAPGHHGYPRISAHIRSHSEKGPEWPVVPSDHGCEGG